MAAKADRDDFQCRRIDDQNVVADQDVIEAAILRYDTHDVFGEYRNVNISRNSRADSDIELFATTEPRRVFFADNRLNSRALVCRQEFQKERQVVSTRPYATLLDAGRWASLESRPRSRARKSASSAFRLCTRCAVCLGFRFQRGSAAGGLLRAAENP
jgi:hypothetical protein